MTSISLLDQTVSRIKSDSSDASLRVFYDRIAASELYLLLETEASGEHATPKLIDTPDGQAVLAFDDASRLAEFTGRVVPSLCLSGKDLCNLLSSLKIGIALNFDVSEHPYFLTAESVEWISGTLADTATQIYARPAALQYPKDLPQSFLQALELRLKGLPGTADRAVLSIGAYLDGSLRLLVAFLGAAPEHQPILTETVRDAVALTLPEREVDIGFFSHSDRITRSLLRNGMSLDLPCAPKLVPTAPGMDPSNPPRL